MSTISNQGKRGKREGELLADMLARTHKQNWIYSKNHYFLQSMMVYKLAMREKEDNDIHL